MLVVVVGRGGGARIWHNFMCRYCGVVLCCKVEAIASKRCLQVHLKRFQFTAYSRRKLHNLVRFPLATLDMAPYVARDSESEREAGDYELYAVVHHLVRTGEGMRLETRMC